MMAPLLATNPLEYVVQVNMLLVPLLAAVFLEYEVQVNALLALPCSSA